jgi:hypothetical protein
LVAGALSGDTVAQSASSDSAVIVPTNCTVAVRVAGRAGGTMKLSDPGATRSGAALAFLSAGSGAVATSLQAERVASIVSQNPATARQSAGCFEARGVGDTGDSLTSG